MSEFKRVSDVCQYATETIRSGLCEIRESAKVAPIQAVQGVVGQQVETILDHTKNTVKLDPQTGAPGWIATNSGGEQYIIEDSDFQAMYEPDPENPGNYLKKVGVLTMELEEGVTFVAPWGEEMSVPEGGRLVLMAPDNIYGIHPTAFAETYRDLDTPPDVAWRSAMDMFGVERLYVDFDDAFGMALRASFKSIEQSLESDPALQQEADKFVKNFLDAYGL